MLLSVSFFNYVQVDGWLSYQTAVNSDQNIVISNLRLI